MKHFFLLFFIFIALSNWLNIAGAANVDVPDARLNTELQSALSIATTDPITEAKMLSLTKLAVNGQIPPKIESLTGLESATNLTVLWLLNNNISDLTPISGLTSLADLRLEYNNVSDLTPIENLTSLTMLVLSDNAVGDTGIGIIANFTSLTWLNVISNGITDISSLGDLTSLTFLDIANNSISDISILENFTSLTSIEIRGNPITDMRPILRHTSLTSVDFRPGLMVPEDVQNGPFDVTVTFSKTVDKFIPNEKLIGTNPMDATVGDPVESDDAYTVTITPVSDGELELRVPVYVVTT